MGVFDLIRTVFGLGGSDESEGTEVSVEHEPGADAESLAAEEPDRHELEEEELDEEELDEEEPDGEPVATDTDATGSTASMTDEPDDVETAAEPAEAGTGVSDHSGTDTAAAEPAEAAGPVPDEPEGGSEPVESVSGIGPAYAKRLGEAGVETVSDLLGADPDELAEETDLSAKRIGRWQERAEDL
jgi:predicted flap endonuclease-1-like 5' DNA nuclease